MDFEQDECVDAFTFVLQSRLQHLAGSVEIQELNILVVLMELEGITLNLKISTTEQVKIPVLSIVKRWFGVMQEILSKGNLWRLVHSTNDMVWQLYALSAMIFLSMKIPFTDILAILIGRAHV